VYSRAVSYDTYCTASVERNILGLLLEQLAGGEEKMRVR
jgi:hypothetical protein